MEEIDIKELLKYYATKIYIVLLFVLIGTVGSIYYTNNKQVPKYKSEAKIALINQSTTITQNDVNLNKNLVSTYREIIKSRRIMNQVIENLSLDMIVEELSKMISVSSANDTELIVITVKNEDSLLSRNIANETARIFQKEIVNIYNIENIYIYDPAVEAEEPYNIHVVKQYAIGIGLGFIIGSAIVLTLFYFDDSIKGKEDIENKVELSVLAQVPRYRYKKKKGDK